MKPAHQTYIRISILLFTVICGAILRFTNVNWDEFGAFHPDERNISWAGARLVFFSQMDPKFFAYGGLPIYLYRGLGEITSKITNDPIWTVDWGHLAVIGRYVSAILSTVSILLVFFVGLEYFSPSVGVLSAFLLSFSPWAVQQAHFSTTETMLVFFLLLLLIVSHRLLLAKSVSHPTEANRSRYQRTILLLGLIWGFALAAKTTSLLFGVIPVTAIILSAVDKVPPKRLPFKTLFKILFPLVGLGISAAAIFFLFSPYTILDFIHFKESMTYESGVALGRFTVPYTLQFLHTAPYIYQLVTMVWQAGLVTVIGIAGLILMLLRIVRKTLPFQSAVTFVIFPLIYFGWVGMWYAKFARYNVPFLPFVTIAAAWCMVSSLQWFKRHRGLYLTGILAYCCIGIVTVAWCLAHWSIYLRPQTRITATDWILNNIPYNTHIYTEHWNDGLPLDRPDAKYNREILTVYEEPDGDAKRLYYTDKLITGDYIILSTRRIWATMPRLQQKYPVTSLFYKKLLNGELGYREVASFTSYPQLFGLKVNDDTAEESLQVFDHPTVRIFQNTGRFSRQQILNLLSQ